MILSSFIYLLIFLLSAHHKITVSNSLPIVQNAAYNLPKSGSNNNLIRYEQPSSIHSESRIDRSSKSYDIYEENKINNEEKLERRRSKYETDLMQQMDLNGDRKEEHEVSQPSQLQDFKVGEKVTCLKTTMSERPVPHKVSIEYRPKDFTSSLPPEVRISDGNATDISTLPSEDELSNGSGSVSPR